MTTETTPDPIIVEWSETLEADLVEAGMEQPEAHAYRQAFELGLTRVMSTVATKQELRDGLADLRDGLQREMELRFAEINRRLDDAQAQNDRRFDDAQAQTNQRFDDAQAQTNQRFDDMQAQTNQRFDDMQAQSDQRFAALQQDFAQRFDAAERRTNERFDELEKRMADRFEEMDKRFRLLVAAFGVGFAMLAGFLSAVVILVA